MQAETGQNELARCPKKYLVRSWETFFASCRYPRPATQTNTIYTRMHTLKIQQRWPGLISPHYWQPHRTFVLSRIRSRPTRISSRYAQTYQECTLFIHHTSHTTHTPLKMRNSSYRVVCRSSTFCGIMPPWNLKPHAGISSWVLMLRTRSSRRDFSTTGECVTATVVGGARNPFQLNWHWLMALRCAQVQ